AYIWRKNEQKITKVFAKSKEVKSIKLDPYRETGDIDEDNNNYPRTLTPTRFELFKQQTLPRGATSGANPMQQSIKKQP
ncbi:MAG: M1 family peptidase, partial [Sphingobacteriaceae bacterium]